MSVPPQHRLIDLDKVVLVTGGSSGIGRATCRLLVDQGWRVYGASRRAIPEVAGPKVARTEVTWRHLTMDVTDEAAIAAAMTTLSDEAGRLDAVVHCAGESFVAPIEEASIAEVQRHFDLNVFGTVRVLQAVLPVMRAQRHGKLIVIGSIGGLIGLPFHGYYSAGKFALDGLIEALRPEIKPFGIDATVLHPGDIDTEIGQNRVATAQTDAGSPYHAAYQRAVASYAAAEQAGSHPDLVAKEIARLLAKPHMPVRALAGKSIEKLGVVAKRLLPSRQFEYVMARAYGPGTKDKD